MCKQTTKNNLEKAPSPVNITSSTSVPFRIHFPSHARHPLNHFANFGGLWTNFFLFFFFSQLPLEEINSQTADPLWLSIYSIFPSEFSLFFSLARLPRSHARYVLARAINLSDLTARIIERLAVFLLSMVTAGGLFWYLILSDWPIAEFVAVTKPY